MYVIMVNSPVSPEFPILLCVIFREPEADNELIKCRFNTVFNYCFDLCI